jgi:hypothetical protein
MQSRGNWAMFHMNFEVTRIEDLCVDLEELFAFGTDLANDDVVVIQMTR